MEGLLTLLLLAGVFYFMMRFGCGAHAVHGHGGHAGHGGGSTHDPPSSEVATDPVCGMEVEPGHGYSKSYGGHDYRFCSRTCLERFEADPDRYTSTSGGAA